MADKQSKAMEELNKKIRQSQNEHSLAAGGLTVEATERLSAQASDKHLRFGSNLSVSEFLLTRACGYRPVGQVMGSSVFHVGWMAMPAYSSGEIVALSHALQQARLLAASRLQQEAALLRADGVVGVRLNRNKYAWGRNLIEFSFMGTAVRMDGQEQRSGPPFISTLSGQELTALTAGGFRPVGLVGGNSVWYQVASFQTMLANNQIIGGTMASYNQELVDFTDGFSTAREIASEALDLECRRLNAGGVVGLEIEKEIFPYERKVPGQDQDRTDLIVSFQMLGTAISEMTDTAIPPVDYGLML